MNNITALRPESVEQSGDDVVLTGFEDVPAVMSPKVLADVIEVTPLTLQRWRDQGAGPAWHRFPGSNLIRYTRADLVAWLAGHRVAPDEVQS